MAPSERFPGWRCSTLLAGVLVLGLAACGDKPAPEPAATPIPPVTQGEPKKDETKMAAPAPAIAKAEPDSDLAANVKGALAADGGINVHRIDVDAASGVVTLYGTADTSDQRAKAAQIAAGVAGVKSVENKLAIVAGS